jgi:hypothetical protein
MLDVRQTQGTTARKYLDHVLYWFKSLRLPPPFLRDDWQLSETLSGAERLAPAGSNAKDPFTTSIIMQLWDTSRFDPKTARGRRNRAISAFAQLGLARSESYCVTGGVADFDPAVHLTCRDVEFISSSEFPKALSVFVCKSKMDKRRFGLVKYFACTGSRFCAWSTIRNMLVIDRSDASPFDALFVNEKGLPMTYSYWHDELRFAIKEARLDHLRYNTHSFRRGGASAAFDAQVEERVIMFGGDWRDPRSLDAYVVREVNIMLRMSRSIANAKPVFDSVSAARSRRARQLSGVLDQSSAD